MHAVDLRPRPPQPVPIEAEFAQERRADGHEVDGGTEIVQQPRHDRLAGASAAADPVGRLQHRDPQAGPGQGVGGGQTVGPGTDDGRSTHPAHSIRSTCRTSFETS